jgi:Methyltransferase domain
VTAEQHLDYRRLYEFRFKDVNQAERERVWHEIAQDLFARLGSPSVLLDPAAGRCEFINAAPAQERWAIDVMDTGAYRAKDVKSLTGNVLEMDLPEEHFDGVLVSNFLEHLDSPDAVAAFLQKMKIAMKPGAAIAILGPNFRYCPRQYFDCADHTLTLTHISVEEHLFAAGLAPTSVSPRYLPYSFRGVLPPSPSLTRIYLKHPLLWRFLGKQFLIVATK